MKNLLIAIVILSGTSFTAQAYVPNEQHCPAIYAADTNFYATAAKSEKLFYTSEIYSMRLERNGAKGTMFVGGSDGSSLFLMQIHLEQACSGEVVEIPEVQPL